MVMIFDGAPQAAGFIRQALIELAEIRVILLTYMDHRVQIWVQESEVDAVADCLETLKGMASGMRN